jgi:hypothetical protein
MSGEQVRVDGRHHDVVIAVATRVGAVMLSRRASLAKSRIPHSMMAANCASWAARSGVVSRPSVRVKMRPTNSLPLFWLSCAGVKKEIQDVLRPLDVLHGVGTGFVDPAVHLTAALRTGRCEDHSAYEVRALQRYLLGDEAADGEAEEVHLGEAQRVHESQRVPPELLERPRRGADREAYATRVEQDDLALSRDVVDEGGSQLSRLPRKCWKKTTGTVPALPKRRYA